MTFAGSKFRAFLPAATFAMAAEFLMGLSDSVICGHVVGETGLAAVNLMQGVFDIVNFVSLLVAIGASVLFSTEVGAFHLRRARGYFTLGLGMSVVMGLLMALVLALTRIPVLAAFGVAAEVHEAASAYWLWYLPAAVLQPIVFYLGTMCYADGDARLSMISYVVQIVGNCALSVPLTIVWGTAGCAMGTGLGAFVGICALLFHFRRPSCMLGFSRHFAFSDILGITRTSLGDASKSIAKAVLMFALNAYVIARFGSEALPVLAVVVMTIGVSEIFDGVGNAAQPLIGVYVGENNGLLTRRVMRMALRLSLFEGVGVMTLLLACPRLMLSLAGLDDPALVHEAIVAVRLVSAALLGLAIVLLFNSYYVFIRREGISTALTLLAILVMPFALFPVGGAFWGMRGVWGALGAAPLVALGVFAVYLLVRFGARRFPLLLDDARNGDSRVFDLVLEPDSVCAVSTKVEEHVRRHGVDVVRAAKAALLVEETLMVVRDRNAGRCVLAEVTVDLNGGGLTLVLRDDGEVFDITDSDAKISSLRSYLVSNLMGELPHRRNLTTTGFNRNVYRL